MGQCSYSCEDLKSDVDNISNPDIAGIGVLVGFMATAYLTMVIMVTYYLLDYVPSQIMNRIDKGVVNFVWRKARSKPSVKWEHTLRYAVLTYSDQQLITGLAILAGAFAQLSCGLSIYSWQIVVYLAWFSSLTHLTTLTFLRQFFRTHPAARLWRVSLMLIMFVMLITGLLPTGSWRYSYAARPAICVFQGLIDEGYSFIIGPLPLVRMLFSLIVLVVSYFTRVVKLFDSASHFVSHWIRVKPGNAIKARLAKINERKMMGQADFAMRLKSIMLEIVYVTLKAYFDIYESVLWEILWLGFALAWGTQRLYATRLRPEYAKFNDGNYWGFGQLVAVFLMVLPVLSIGQSYFETSKLHTRSSHSQPQHDRPLQTQQSWQSYHNGPPRPFKIGTWPKSSNLITDDPPPAPIIRKVRPSIIPQTKKPPSTTTHAIRSIDTAAAAAPPAEKPFRVSDPESALPPHPYDRALPPLPSSSSTTINVMNTINTSLPPPHDYYTQEYFLLLLTLLYLTLSAIFIYVLAAGGGPLFLVLPILIALTTIFLLTTLFVAFFVTLAEFHEGIGRGLERGLGISERWQRRVLRGGAYVYLVVAVAAVVVPFGCFGKEGLWFGDL